MKKEKIEVSIFCDCCSKELYDNGIRKNDGSFQEPYLKRDDDTDLCWDCVGKIFYLEINRKVPNETMNQWVQEHRSKISGCVEEHTECAFIDSLINVPLGVADCSEEPIEMGVSNSSLSSIDDPKSIKDL
jgi:hypothetical protein